MGFPNGSVVKKKKKKKSVYSAGDIVDSFDPWVRQISWRRKWQLTPVFLPEKSHRQRSLAGYSLKSQA